MDARVARGLGTAGLLLSVVLAWATGIVVRTVTLDVPFVGVPAERDDYRVAAGAGLMTALLLVLGLVAVRSLRAPGWLAYATAAGVATQLALGLTAWWSSRSGEETVVVTTSVWDGAGDVLAVPGSWPLLLVLLVATVGVVRGRWSRAPR